MCPVVHERVVAIEGMLPVVRRPNRTPKAASIYVVFVLHRKAECHSVILAGLPIPPDRKQQIVERRGRETGYHPPGCQITNSDQYDAVLITIFKRAKEPRPVALDGSAD